MKPKKKRYIIEKVLITFVGGLVAITVSYYIQDFLLRVVLVGAVVYWANTIARRR